MGLHCKWHAVDCDYGTDRNQVGQSVCGGFVQPVVKRLRMVAVASRASSRLCDWLMSAVRACFHAAAERELHE